MIVITSVDESKKFFLRQEDVLEICEHKNWAHGGDSETNEVYIRFKYSIESSRHLLILDIQLKQIYEMLMEPNILSKIIRNFDWRYND